MIPLFSQPKKVSEETENHRAVFEIEALYPGYGVTVGNSLRRVLLSSLPGAAIVKMKVQGNKGVLPHEFSTVPGVYEDVISLMLNLKKLRFKVQGDESQKGRLKVKGEKEVKGKDFELPSQLELVNPQEHVASLTDKKAELEIEIEVGKGMGYVPREARAKEKLAVGEILLDAVYSPVQKVGYNVEQMRVGDRTDFDKLRLEIETDGTLTPGQALQQAAQILVDHFGLVAQSLAEMEAKALLPEKTEKKRKTAKKAVAKKKPAKAEKKPASSAGAPTRRKNK